MYLPGEIPNRDSSRYDHVLTTDDELTHPEHAQQVVPPGKFHPEILMIMNEFRSRFFYETRTFCPHGEVNPYRYYNAE